MSWSSIFPVFGPELVANYRGDATAAERAVLAEMFAIERTNGARPAAHIISTSLFWKQGLPGFEELPPLTRTLLRRANVMNMPIFRAPWSSYVHPLLRGAEVLRQSGTDALLRVYLAGDMDFLEKDLLQAGCEVVLMKHCSTGHLPGAMWRFLALAESDRPVTIIDADEATTLLADVLRTEEMVRAGLKFWRTPRWLGSDETSGGTYRPIQAGHFGCAHAIPIRQLMEAFIWATEKGLVPNTAVIPGCGQQAVKGTLWPYYGFDEWFLLAAIFPRVAQRGMLTMCSVSARSVMLPLDVEYTTWSNPRSEFIYFGEGNGSSGGCCGVPKKKGPRKRLKPKTSNGKVLLTGLWQVKTCNDVLLIKELCNYARAQDMPVVIRPVLHVRDENLFQMLPAWLRREAILWRKLAFSTKVQMPLMHAMCMGQDADWIWEADSDERVDFSCVGGLRAAMERADKSGVDYVPGDWIDRVAMGNILPDVDLKLGLARQFPRSVLAVRFISHGDAHKTALHRRECLTGVGNHGPLDPNVHGSAWRIPIWHFKWHSDCRAHQEDKLQADREEGWAESMVHSVEQMTVSGTATVIDWDGLPKQAFPKLSSWKKKGAYPLA